MIRFMFNIKNDWIMKRISIFVMAAVLLSLCGLVSCTSETEILGNGEDTGVTRSIVFNISLPTGDPVHIKTRTAIQDNLEYSIKSLSVLVFDAATDKLLKAPVTVDASSLGEGAAYNTSDDWKYEYTYDPSDEGKTCRFIFVANEDVSSLAQGATLADVLATVSSSSRTFTANSALSSVFAETNGLPMTGVAYYNVGSAKNEIIPIDKTAENITVNVELTRVVARIDVYNKTPNLFITDIRLVHANPQSYLMPHKDANSITEIPAAMEKVGGATGGLQLYNNVWDTANNYTVSTTNPMTGSATEDGIPLKKAFYCYEDDIFESATAADLEAEALAVQITGRLGSTYESGVDVFYQIPFINKYKSGGTDDHKSVEIKRNYIYKVIVGDGNPVNVNSSIRMSLTVNNWTNTEVSSTFEDALFTSEPAAALATYNRDTQLITLASNAAVTTGLSIKVTDTYANSVNITGVEVLTSGFTWEAAGSTTGWLRATIAGDNKSVDLTADANNDATVRIGSVRITYSYKDNTGATQSGAKIVFSVKQPNS